MADRIGEGFQFLVAAEQLLVQFGHFLGLAQHDIDDGRAHLVCRVAVSVAPRQAALLHGLLPGLERVARGQRHARCCFLAGIAAPAHGAHHFRAEPHQVTVMQLRNGHRQQAAGDVGQVRGRRPVGCQVIGAVGFLAGLLRGQPVRQGQHVAGRRALANTQAIALVHDRRAGQRQQAGLVLAQGRHEVLVAGHATQ